ncbi:SLAM family member 5-like isoform X1 [Brienomyrus brachyistius]|uniref:SLAM family member 5-like isoform X1 n=1 Tax=Brienomyrus brachyistius TaxID=42636 RepID=UPI0020B2255D|nr:SLAM family member 5-like isoform X1 [Brienomyrus brachyistius]
MKTSHQRSGLALFAFSLIEFCTFFTHAEIQQVQGIVGGAFTFPAPVISVGTLSYGNIGNVAIVVPGSSKTDLTEEFRGRLWWDSKTGLFTITDLQIQDSGQYKVDSSDGGKKVTEYQLTVYNRVSKPRVSASGSCWVLCSVENGRDVTLSWYRGTETLNQTSSPDLSTSLSLPLEVEHRYTYYCEAKNPASSQNLTLEIPANCSDTSGDIPSPRSFLIPVLVVCGLVLPIVIVIIIATCLKKRKRATACIRTGSQFDAGEAHHRVRGAPADFVKDGGRQRRRSKWAGAAGKRMIRAPANTMHTPGRVRSYLWVTKKIQAGSLVPTIFQLERH